MVHEADFMAAKGVGFMRVQTPAGKVDLYNTHLVAEYSTKPETADDAYHIARVCEAFELAQLIRSVSTSAPLVVLCGDMNLNPSSLAVRMVRTLAGIEPSCSGSTFGTMDNCFSFDNDEMTLDYILWKGSKTWSCSNSQVCHFKAQIPGGSKFALPNEHTVALSDHWAVSATFTVIGKSLTHHRKQEGPKEAIEAEQLVSDASALVRQALGACTKEKRVRYLRAAAGVIALLALFAYHTLMSGPPATTAGILAPMLASSLLTAYVCIEFSLRLYTLATKRPTCQSF